MSELKAKLDELMEAIEERDRTYATMDLRSYDVDVDRTNNSLKHIYAVVYKALLKEKHRYKGKFACRVVGETPRWFKILLWGDLGHAELKVVPKEDVTALP